MKASVRMKAITRLARLSARFASNVKPLSTARLSEKHSRSAPTIHSLFDIRLPSVQLNGTFVTNQKRSTECSATVDNAYALERKSLNWLGRSAPTDRPLHST